MKFPSKELLSAVLGIDVNEVKGIEANTPICGCVHSDGWYDEINIYELAHKCKEWAKKKEYWAISGYDEGYFCMLHDMPDNRFFNASTEIEAIFKACEYIMEQTKCGS